MSKTKFRVAYLLLRWNKALWLAFESHVTSYSALFQRSYSKICLTLDQGPGHSYFKTALLTKRSEKTFCQNVAPTIPRMVTSVLQKYLNGPTQ